MVESKAHILESLRQISYLSVLDNVTIFVSQPDINLWIHQVKFMAYRRKILCPWAQNAKTKMLNKGHSTHSPMLVLII